MIDSEMERLLSRSGSTDPYLIERECGGLQEAREAAIRDLDELVGYGVIAYSLTERPGRDPLLDVRCGPDFEKGLPGRATARCAVIFRIICENDLAASRPVD